MELWIFDKKRGRRSILSTSGDAHPLAPLPGADSPYQGEMSRRDKRGRDAVTEGDGEVVADLQLVAIEYLPSIDGAAEILIGVTFLRGRL